MTGKELRVNISESLSKRSLKESMTSSNSRKNLTRVPLMADIELKKYLKSSAISFKNLNGGAFLQARQFYRTPSPHTPIIRRKLTSRNLKLPLESKITTPEILTERKPKRSLTPWLTENSTKPSDRGSPDLGHRQSSPINRLRNLDVLISDITNSSEKEKRSFNSNMRQGRQKYSKIKELMELTSNDDLSQFKE